MRILGIDYGEKRIGLAISDELGMLARELKIVSPKQLATELPKLVVEFEVGAIVLGWPLNMSGQQTDKTREVSAFKEMLEQKTALPVILIDERWSSKMASNLPGAYAKRTNHRAKRGGHKNLDSLAAQIILQNYLDKQKSSQ